MNASPGGNGGGNGGGHGGAPGLQFPCRYEIKAMGRASSRFDALVVSIVSRHIGDGDLRVTTRRYSRNRRYLSVTCIIRATTREQLVRIYSDLRACPEVLMTL